MYLILLNSEFIKVGILEVYNSLLWTERYFTSGDFEVTCGATTDLLEALKGVVYVELAGIDTPERLVMEIEGVHIATDPESGDVLTIKGNTLDQKLNRRIVWSETSLETTLDAAVKTLFENAVAGSPIRTIPNFVYVGYEISHIEVFSYFWGEFVIEAIESLCRASGVGFYVRVNATNVMEFHLREGKNRTYGQTSNLPVSFTTELDNLLRADYRESIRPYKNVCLVVGEPDEDGKIISLTVGTATGSERRETFLKPGISPRDIPPNEYVAILAQKGAEELARCRRLEEFEGAIDPSSYIYGSDYDMGDILVLSDDYGHQRSARVVEMIYFEDGGGFNIYPTFEVADNTEISTKEV